MDGHFCSFERFEVKNLLLKMGMFLGLPLALSGCLYGQCMDGPCAFERARYLKSIKAYGEHWVKEGVTVDQKRADSWACGAARTTLAA